MSKYYTQNKKYIKFICKRAKLVDNNLDVIMENKELFVNGENKQSA